MARPPSYATGAHVLAGCLPDHQSTVAELINTPTRYAVSKHVSGYVIQYTVHILQFFMRKINNHFDDCPDYSEDIVNNVSDIRCM